MRHMFEKAREIVAHGNFLDPFDDMGEECGV